MPRTTITTNAAPGAVGPYSQAVRAGGLLFVSGQIALDPSTGLLVEGGIESQTRRAMTNLAAILDAGGSGLDRVLRTTIYLTDLGDFEAMNREYASFFPDDKPARVTVEVSGLPRGSRVEIDAIALVDPSR